MDKLKRLQEIKEHLDFIQVEYDRQGYISTNTADELIDYAKYLIEQAEKKEYWKKLHRKRANELESAYVDIQLLENKLQQANEKIERYKEAIHDFKTSLIVRDGLVDTYYVLSKLEQELEGSE